MSDAHSELSRLRDELSRLDDDLVRTLAERMRVVRDVATLKVGAGIPPFDRARETEKLDALLARSSGVDLPEDLVRDVIGAVFTASRRAQRVRIALAEPRFSIGVVGGTSGMGAFLGRVFEGAGYPVETMGLGSGGLVDGPPAVEIASRNDLVIVAVPIAATLAVIREIAPRVRAGACLMDVTSIKGPPLAAMLGAAPPQVDVVGTHPMFGPSKSSTDFDRQKVVLCRGRGEDGIVRVKRLFEALGAEVIEADATEHDAQMALIQVLVHEKTMVLGSVLERLGADLARSLEFASPIYRAELAMIGRLYSQEAGLYADILTSNPEGARVSKLFEEEAKHFADAIASGEREFLVTRFCQVRAFLSEFAAWARKQSDAILSDIVRHG
jgi:chorismate mutase/prephenate dehydrogenase